VVDYFFCQIAVGVDDAHAGAAPDISQNDVS
jgi:hypothetical protein